MPSTLKLTREPVTLLRIGEVKQRSQVPIKTIRYYEELGLIKAKKRSEGGFRLFSTDVLPRLAFIKRSQKLGLSLQEINEILSIHDHGELPCEEVKQKFQTKIHQIEEQIEQLGLLKAQLQTLISVQPSAASSDSICPIIESADTAAG
ncbi:MAG: heavy metal-responsive transcriptional regulator [Leptolyngbya sp. SIO4C1]|nr:heavy metal-responsive transcriptional regulator [Leptolyngbya sp. SIO4C1]